MSDPVRMPGVTDAVAVAAGFGHSLILKSDGTVLSCGSNSSGQLGLGGLGGYFEFATEVPGLAGVRAISAGMGHNLALLTDGTVRAWGANTSGQLGLGFATPPELGGGIPGPAQVLRLTGVTAVDCGGSHSMALAPGGAVWIWGDNFNSQLGRSGNQNSPVPQSVEGLPPVRVIQGAEFHSLAIAWDGTVWGWGLNFYGQLGDGTRDQDWTGQPAPRPALGLQGATAIAGGQFYSLAVVGRPPPPEALRAAALGSTVVRLQWIQVLNPNRYRIERRQPGGTFGVIADMDAPPPSAPDLDVQYLDRDSGLLPARQYEYRVSALNGTQVSGPSSIASVTTWPVLAPGLLVTPLSSTRIQIGLVILPNVHDGHQLERRTGSGSFEPATSLQPSESVFVDSGLMPGTTYTYRARAFYGSDYSAYSSEAMAATFPLESPVLLEVAAGGTDSLRLVWVDRSLEERAFRIEHSPDGIAFSPLASVDGAAGAGTTLAYLHQGLLPGSTHAYRIQALVEEDMVSPYSDVRSGTTREVASPSRLTALPLGSTRVQLTWTDNSDVEEGFLIERAENADPIVFTMEQRLVGRHRTDDPVTWTDTTVAAGMDYLYRVKSYRALEESTYSNTAMCTTPEALAAPTGLRAERVGKVMRISFRDSSGAADGYAVFARPDGVTTERRLRLVRRGTGGPEVRLEHRLGRAPLAPAALRWQFRVTAYRLANGEEEFGPSTAWVIETPAPGRARGR